jgi:hypothetical protein
MLVFMKLASDFSRGCAHPTMRSAMSATHPHPTSAEEPEPRHWGSGPELIARRASVVGA